MDKLGSQETKTVDMSPEAIDRRLRTVSQLHKLGMAIREARSKDLGVVEEPRENGTDPRSTS